MLTTGDPIALAREISDGVLFPGALEADASEVVPIDRLDRLAAAGFYGLAGPRDAGGMGLSDFATALEIIEILASGCLTTAFVWVQHHGAVRALVDAWQPLRDAWLPRLCRGEVRAGVAFSGLRRPGPPILTAEADGDGWRFNGFAPWVTGWGRIDVVRAAARREDGDIVWALVDATAGPTLGAEPLRLAAVNASATVTLRFEDQADPDTMPEQRARASELALRAATTLVVSGGGRSITMAEHAQRLAREALFLLVFGQTAAIKAAQLHRLYDGSHG